MDGIDAPAQRINLKIVSTTNDRQARVNHKRSMRYPHVEFGDPKKPGLPGGILRYPECAVVGGGPSVEGALAALRNWPGDIFAVNDTAGYLSDNGIPCYVYSIDGTPVPFKIGINVKGALFATRCHKNQFRQMGGRPIRVFTLTEESPIKGGIEGGPTGACRTPHLLLSMGYRGITFFGLDGSFSSDITHVSGHSDSAFDNMLIISAGGRDYITHSGFMLQNEWLVEAFKRHGMLLKNASGGLLAAMIENPDTWSVVAIADDLKEKYEAGGNFLWSKPYKGGFAQQAAQ